MWLISGRFKIPINDVEYWRNIGRDERKERLSVLLQEIREKNLEAHYIMASLLEDMMNDESYDVEGKRMFRVSYQPEGPRMLELILPIGLFTLKDWIYIADAKIKRFAAQYTLFKQNWLYHVAYALKLGQEQGCWRELEPFSRAVVFIEVHFTGRLKDPDNFTITLLHNALVRNRILLSDDCEHVQYAVRAVKTNIIQKTKITVIDANSNYQNCKLCSLFLYSNSK